MFNARIASALILGSALTAIPVAAQSTRPTDDRPFLFSVSTPRTDTPHATVHVETGFGERPFDLTEGDQPEQRLGVQATLGHRFTMLGRVGIVANQSSTRTSQQGEILYSVLQSPERQANLAAGFGIRHEPQGINVLLGRVAAGRRFSAWRVDGNALFEKPLSIDRDTVDLITTIGVARRVTRAMHVGLEMIGEDLEGFWDPNEAEGGARLLVGPSIRFAPPSAKWQVGAAGGPMIHATHSAVISDATRSLPAAAGKDGYAVRASLSYAF
jgi:hypothetical protein